MRSPTNTPIDEWLSIWLFHEVNDLLPVGIYKRDYMGMSPEQRKKANLPTNRAEAIAFIKKHRGKKANLPTNRAEAIAFIKKHRGKA